MVLKYHLFWVPRRKVLVGDVAARLERLLREKVEELDGDRKHYVEVDRFFPSSELCGVCGAVNTKLTLPQASKSSNRKPGLVTRETSRFGEGEYRGCWIASDVVGSFEGGLGTWGW